MSDDAITITLSGKISYKDEITVPQAAQIITFLNAPEASGQPLGASGRTKAGKAVASAREALDLSGAKTNPEKIVALAEYVLQDGGESFKVEDVKAQFRRARETAPANFSRDLSAAVQAGWIAQGDGEEYYVTSKIEGIFDGDFKFPKAGNGTRSRSGGKPAKAKGEKPVVFAEVDEFPSQLAGLQPYGRMKSNRDKILWALQFAKSVGLRGLTNKEIEWLTDEIGVGVPNAQISAAFNSGKSAGYMVRSTQDKKIRITDEGETYLRSAGVLKP